MPGAKVVVLYPRPIDVAAFERVYLEEHVPLARPKIAGATKFVFTTVLVGVAAEPLYHRVTEIRFPSMEALQWSLETTGSRDSAAHAISISSGGPPVFLIADEGKVVTLELSQLAGAGSV